MLKIDTLHVTFQTLPRDVDVKFDYLDDLFSVAPLPGLLPCGLDLFTKPVFMEQVKPLHGYAYGYAIIDKSYIEDTQTFKTIRLGSFFYGGNNSRPFFQLNGEGCKLMDFASLAPVVAAWNKVRITRCDIAYDDVEGYHGSILDVVQSYKDGLFKRHGKQPTVSQVGDWISDTDTRGRTLYVGSRQGMAMMRIYEKGKELGIQDSPWIRYELELKAVDVDIPVTILTNPASFFIAINEFNHRFSDALPAKCPMRPKKIDELTVAVAEAQAWEEISKEKRPYKLEEEALWAHKKKYATMQAGSVLLEQLCRNDGDIGSLALFAKSTKIKLDTQDYDHTKSKFICKKTVYPLDFGST